MTELAINRSVEPRTWVLQEGFRLLAYLQLGRSGANSGEVKREDEVWQISSRRRRPEEVVLGDPADPIVAFDRDQATVRGIPEPLPWTFSGRLSRSLAVLGGGDKAITLETAGWRPQATVEGRAVVVDPGKGGQRRRFAAIARRRRSTFVGSAVPGT